MFENNEITNKVNLVIIIIGTFLGIVLGMFLLFNNSSKNKANVYLAILVLLSLAFFGQGFLFRFDLIERFPHVIGIPKVINFLIGPLTYFYVRACTQKGFKLKSTLWLNFIPFGLGVLYHMPYFLKSGTEKYNYLINLLQNGWFTTTDFEMAIQTIHLTIYFGLSFHTIFQYKNHLKNTTSSIDNALQNWVMIFIVIHAIPVLGMIVGFFTTYGTHTWLLIFSSFFIFSFAVLIATLTKPELFHSFPHQMSLPESEEIKIQKYENSNLNEVQKKQFLKKIIQHVELNKPYLEPELTLSQLSNQIKVPSHYVSQVINEVLECNFIEFINKYRIEDYKDKLTNKKYDHFTIIAIAYDVGFNSKSAFYSAFKKHVGATPSSFRKALSA